MYEQLYKSYNELKNEYIYKIKKIQDSLNLISKFIGKEIINDIDIFKPVQLKINEEKSDENNSITREQKLEVNSKLENEIEPEKNNIAEKQGKDMIKNKLSKKDQMKNVVDLAKKMKILAKKMK